jgi:hypothetical protein
MSENGYGYLEQFKCSEKATDVEQAKEKVCGAFEFIGSLKCMKETSTDSIEWMLHSIADLTTTHSEESRKIMWELLKKLSVLDKMDADLFINDYDQ